MPLAQLAESFEGRQCAYMLLYRSRVLGLLAQPPASAATEAASATATTAIAAAATAGATSPEPPAVWQKWVEQRNQDWEQERATYDASKHTVVLEVVCPAHVKPLTPEDCHHLVPCHAGLLPQGIDTPSEGAASTVPDVAMASTDIAALPSSSANDHEATALAAVSVDSPETASVNRAAQAASQALAKAGVPVELQQPFTVEFDTRESVEEVKAQIATKLGPWAAVLGVITPTTSSRSERNLQQETTAHQTAKKKSAQKAKSDVPKKNAWGNATVQAAQPQPEPLQQLPPVSSSALSEPQSLLQSMKLNRLEAHGTRGLCILDEIHAKLQEAQANPGGAAVSSTASKPVSAGDVFEGVPRVLAWDGEQMQGVTPVVDKELPITLLVTTLMLDNAELIDSSNSSLAGTITNATSAAAAAAAATSTASSSSLGVHSTTALETTNKNKTKERPGRIVVAKRTNASMSGSKAKPAPVVSAIELKVPIHMKRKATTLEELVITLAVQVRLPSKLRDWFSTFVFSFLLYFDGIFILFFICPHFGFCLGRNTG